MKMRVNHQMLNDVVNKTNRDSEQLFSEINGMSNDINALKQIWRGEEADIFYTRIDNYLGNLKAIPETYNTFAKFMSKANKLYKEADEEFAKELGNIN